MNPTTRPDLPPLTAVLHRESGRKKQVWRALCPELGVSAEGQSQDEARQNLRVAVRNWLENASVKEIESRLRKGTSYSVEPLVFVSLAKSGEDSRFRSRGLGEVSANALVLAGRAVQGAGALAETAATKSGALAGAVVTGAGGLADKIAEKSGAVAETVVHGAGAVATTVGGAASTSAHFVAKTATGAYEFAGDAATHAYRRAGETGTQVAKRALPLLEGLTQSTGAMIGSLPQNPSLRALARAYKLEGLLDISNRVDIEKQARVVADLKRANPHLGSREIADRLIQGKAIYAGGVGWATSFVPGVALPLLAIDLAAMALLQAELVMQIAAAYGLDLNDPARQGEMLAVFGCVVGGSRAVKLGVAALDNVPVAGAFVSSFSNAAMIYALGRVACNFYEKKLHLQTSFEAMQSVAAENERFLQAAADQQTIAAQALFALVSAANPTLSRAEILDLVRPDLGADAENALEKEAPARPAEELLAALNPEFRDYVVGRAREINEKGAALEEVAVPVPPSFSAQTSPAS